MHLAQQKYSPALIRQGGYGLTINADMLPGFGLTFGCIFRLNDYWQFIILNIVGNLSGLFVECCYRNISGYPKQERFGVINDLLPLGVVCSQVSLLHNVFYILAFSKITSQKFP